jgi:hypothetical protein
MEDQGRRPGLIESLQVEEERHAKEGDRGMFAREEQGDENERMNEWEYCFFLLCTPAFPAGFAICILLLILLCS